MSLAIAYGMKKRSEKMAKGGDTQCEHGKSSCEMCHGGMYAKGGDVEEDMISRIMKKHLGYSKGGQVANDTSRVNPGLEENQFDDLVKRDDLEFHYTGANSGDEIGNEQLEEDERDIIARIMRSRRLKDHNPRPA